jgi:hypothetical protein
MKETGKTKKNLSRPKPFKVHIQDIRESDFNVKEIPLDHQNQVKESEINLGFGVNLGQDFEKKTITIGLRIFYDCVCKSEKCSLLKYEFYTTFLVDNFDQIVKKDKDNNVKIENGFLITLLGVLIGTARGMIAVKTAGHFINKFYLPIMNPEALFKSLFEKQAKNIKKKD